MLFSTRITLYTSVIGRIEIFVTGGAAPAAGALQRDELPAAALHLHPGPQVSYWQQGSNQGIWIFYLNSSLNMLDQLGLRYLVGWKRNTLDLTF